MPQTPEGWWAGRRMLLILYGFSGAKRIAESASEIILTK